MNTKFHQILCAATLLGTATAALAGKSTPTLSEVLGASGVEISGYIDTSYTYSDAGVSPVSGRVFDTEDNSFNLNMIGLSISKLPTEGFGGAVVLNAGEDANVTAASGTGSNDEFDVQQAYVNYGAGDYQFMFGKFATLHGAEVIESKDNPNFSRSILFGFAIPFTHTGVRATYTASDNLLLMAGINNGWDNLKDDNDAKSLEVAFHYAPADNWYIHAEGMVGNEEGAIGTSDRRSLLDIVAGFDVSDALSLMVNVDVGRQEEGTATGGNADWSGVAGYANYQIDPKWRLAGRLEYFNDDDGFRTGFDQEWKEGTVTLAYSPVKSVELRGEVRYDWSNEDVFEDDNDVLEDSQTTVALEAIYMF